MAKAAPEAIEGEEPTQNTTEAQMARFLSLFEKRLDQVEESISRRVDERMQAAEAKIAEQEAELEVRRAAGLIEPPNELREQRATEEADKATRAAAERKVAFIPKEDPANPRNTLFECWLNGKLYRSDRGQVMMLPLGFALDLARSGHGHVIDMTVMQQIQVASLPDEALREKTDGPPVIDPVGRGLASSIPKELLTSMGIARP